MGKSGIKKYEKQAVYLLIIFFALLYSFMSVRRHHLFETVGWDLAVFDSGIWQWSRFRIPFSSFHDLSWLADHFHLILVVLTPLYWIFDKVEALLIAQAVLISFGAFPIYLISKKLTKDVFFSLVVSLGYLTFHSLQWHMFSGFHELAFLPVTLGFTLYFWETKQIKPYWLFFALTLLVKEEMGFLLAAIGVWEFLVDRKRFKQAAATTVLGIFYTLLMTSIVMPAIGGGVYRHLGFGQSGESIIEVLGNIIGNPLLFFKAFIDSPVKLSTMLATFWPWGFLPLFSPATLIPIIEQFASRFLDYGKVIRWTPYFAYSLPMATLMSWGSIHGFKKLTGRVKKLRLPLSIILLVLIVVQQIVLHNPINSIFKRSFYRKEEWMGNNRKVLSCVPQNASVSAQNSLAPWLARRDEIKVFPEGLNRGYEYIVLDLHEGQSENSFHFLGSEKTKFIAKDLVERKLYQEICREGDAVVLKKTKDTTNKLNYPFNIEIYEK